MSDEQAPQVGEQPEASAAGAPSRQSRLAMLVAVMLAFSVGFGVRSIATRPPEPASDAATAAPEQLWTCGMHPHVIQDHPGTCPICHMTLTPLDMRRKAGARSETGITIDPSVVQNMGVRTTVVTQGAFARTVRASGTVVEAEPNIREVNLLVSGWIRRLYADTQGVYLRKHAPIFDLYSPELNNAIEDAIRLRRSAYTRDAAANPGGTSRSLFAAALRRLELLGLSNAQAQRLAQLDQAPRAVTFTSPIAGILTQKRIVDGDAVRAGDSVMRIVDHTTVWIEAKVFEQHLDGVTIGETVVAELAALPGVKHTGKVVFVDPHVDPATRTAVVRLAVANQDTRLRPGMYATVEITVELADDALLVPSEAVIDTGARKVVFVSLGAGHFEGREVETGASDGAGTLQVLTGLRAGETVVTSGQFLLDAESRTREAVQKFLHEREGVEPEPSVNLNASEPATPQQAAPETKSSRGEAPAKPRPRPTSPRAPSLVEPSATPPDDPSEGRPKPAIYTCPMHPEVVHEGPGACPVCGMDLVPKKQAG